MLWTLPALIGLIISDSFRLHWPIEPVVWVIIGASFSLGWLGGLGEGVGWTSYLLPRLAPHCGKRWALVIAGAIRGLWHWPVLSGPVIAQGISGEQTFSLSVVFSAISSLFLLLVTNALFGSLFGWVWYRTKSLPLMGWLHQWFDATRDVTALLVIGYSSSLWFTILWGVPFYLSACLALRQAGREGCACHYHG